MSVDMISRIESGTTGARFSTISKIADALGVGPAELFSSELVREKMSSPVLNELVAKLSALSESDLRWVSQLLDAALRRR